MRKFLLAATLLAPFAVAPAFAGGGMLGGIAAGDVNIGMTSAGSSAGVSSVQGTKARANVAGKGGVIVGAVSGNTTSVQTTAQGTAGPKGSYTNTTATQSNIGGTVTGGLGLTKWPVLSDRSLMRRPRRRKGASGSASGGQTSQATGNADAKAANVNIGGFVTMQAPKSVGGSHR